MKGYSQNPPVLLLANFISQIAIVNNAGIVQHNNKVTNGSSTSEVQALQAPCQYLMATALFTLSGLQGSKNFLCLCGCGAPSVLLRSLPPTETTDVSDTGHTCYKPSEWMPDYSIQTAFFFFSFQLSVFERITTVLILQTTS